MTARAVLSTPRQDGRSVRLLLILCGFLWTSWACSLLQFAVAEELPRDRLREIDEKRNDLQAKIELLSTMQVGPSGLSNLAEAYKDLYLLDYDDPRTRLGAALAMQNDSPEVVTEHLFAMALEREPTKEELTRCQEHLAKNRDKPKMATEDIIWALCNTKEFADRLRQ